MAAIPSRKSLVQFEINESAQGSPSSISPRRRRSIAVPKATETALIEENDDEAERLARREKNESNSPVRSDRRQSLGLASISGLTAGDITNQISQCIKLSAENKINDKNAFQLKMIDFLVYTLKKQDPKMSNLQMASTTLDVSAKIYGYRVDKVHSELIKIVAGVLKEKRDSENRESDDTQDNDQSVNLAVQQKKKRRKNRSSILATTDGLKGNIDTYDPLSLIRCQRDTQTSDMLFQAALPQHCNQGIALNLYNDVLLDDLPATTHELEKYECLCVQDYSDLVICPSYSTFKFLGWSPDDEPEQPNSQPEENDGAFRFDLDADVNDHSMMDDHDMMDCGEAYEVRCDQQAQKNHQIEKIVDFHDIIANNPNPDATYEYSYVQKNLKIHWAGPSHWKIIVNKIANGTKAIDTQKKILKQNKKEIEIDYLTVNKEEFEDKFCQANKMTKLVSKTTKQIWSDEKITFPQDMHYDVKSMCTYFNKQTEYLKFLAADGEANSTFIGPDEPQYDYNNENDTMNYCGPDLDGDADHVDTDPRSTSFDINTQDGFNPTQSQGFFDTQTQGAFIGDNLVSAPTLVNKVFIPYSQRAKKIDMRQLKRVMWKDLKDKPKDPEKENVDSTAADNENESATKEFDNKHFNELYKNIPTHLSKTNADSLSPSIAFVTLLHLANEKNLTIDNSPDLSDLTIRNHD